MGKAVCERICERAEGEPEMIMFRIILVAMLLVGMFLGIVIALSIRIKKIDQMPDIEDVQD